jgi:dipeptidyl aminopeptidase/acylaminoacyl peptidase
VAGGRHHRVRDRAGPDVPVAAAGGDPKPLIALPDDGSVIDFHQPTVLPGGRGLIYAVHGRGGTETLEVFDGTSRKVVLRAEERARSYVQILNLPAYSPTGHIIYRVDDGNIGVWAVPFSLERLESTGDPFLVASGARNPSVARDGTLIYTPTADAAPSQLVWLRADGTVERTVGDVKHGIDRPAIAPDGKRIVFSAVENNNSDLWVFSEGQGTSRITSTTGNETRPQWMPDGRTLVSTCAADQRALCARPADGSGETRVLIKDGADVRFSPDGRHAVYQTMGTAERGLKVFDLQTAQSRPYVLSPFELLPMDFSPDGRYFAYASFKSGQPRIYLRQFPAGDGEWEIPELRAERINWPRGGRELFAIVGSGRELPLVAVTVDTQKTPVFGKPRPLFTASEDTRPMVRGFIASPDGKRFLTIQRQLSQADVGGIVVVQNWLAEFRR